MGFTQRITGSGEPDGISPISAAAAQDGTVTRALPYNAHRPIVAAAQRVSATDKREVESVVKRQKTATWQRDVWDYYDLIGEIKYGLNLFANVMSRIRLYPAQVTGGNVIPSALEDVEGLPEGLVNSAHAAMSKLASSRGGIAGLLRDATLNLSVTGECWLVQIPAKYGSGQPERWEIKSTDEFVTAGGRATPGLSPFGLKPRRDAGANEIDRLPETAFMGRIWRTHPRYSDEADSSLRGQIELMDELLLLNKTFRATARSRLNAGMIYIPDGLDIAGSDTGESADTLADPDVIAPYTDDDSDSFIDDFMDALTTPIQDESSASAVAPLIVRGPESLGGAIKQFKFERSFDPQLAQRADKVLDRILAGLDLPKEVVTGIAMAKHTPRGSQQIEESLYKQHIEPMCLMICDALTVVFLRPVLLALGYEPALVERVVFWYDPSSINTKPDKATAATTGYNMKVLSADAWRRANGFSDTDAPPPLELAQRIAQDRGQLSEPITEALFRTLIPDIMQQTREQTQAANPAPMGSDVAQALGVGAEDVAAMDGTDIPAPGMTPSGPTPSPETPDTSPKTPPGGLLEP